MAASTIGDLVRHGGISAVYQPIVDLQTGDVVAYEALARRLRPPLGLFAKVEPAVLATRAPDHLRPLLDEALRSLRVTVEVTERALVADPAGLLAAVARTRKLGWTVALDDVGAHPDSVALMPFLQPEVIKLDLRLIQGRPDREVAKVINAVITQAEATGARILAEGVETEEHLAVALATSASLGQGWYFGRPRPVLPTLDSPEVPLEFSGGPRLERQRTPFELAADGRKAVVPKRVMQVMSLHLERNAFVLPERPVILSTFQDVGFFTLTRGGATPSSVAPRPSWPPWGWASHPSPNPVCAAPTWRPTHACGGNGTWWWWALISPVPCPATISATAGTTAHAASST